MERPRAQRAEDGPGRAAAGALLLAAMAALPAGALGPQAALPPPAEHDALGLGALGSLSPLAPVQRFLPRAPGTDKALQFLYGPFTVGPGQDLTRVTVEVPLHDGFLTAVRPRLVDASTGAEPTNMDVHIHHAHWLRYTQDPDANYYLPPFAWVFGTGEERTAGSLDERAAAQPGGPRYGVFLERDEPQVMVYMLHNKQAVARTLTIVLELRFVYGSGSDIAAASTCANPVPLPDEACAAGQRFHDLTPHLWGSTFDVPRQAGGSGVYVYPPGQPLGRRFTAAFDGTLVVSAGHIHPNGRDIVVANLGPSDKPCGDLDRDGWPGITLYRSTKFDRTPAAQPFSEDFQMGVTKPGFRAPLRAGDRITQWALYMNEDYATYQAMGYVGLFIDRAEAPAPRGGEGCTLANTAPRLLDEPLGDPTQSVMNRPWEGEPLPLCGPGLGPGCEGPEAAEPPGMEARQVHIAGFLYVPGDMGLGGELGAPPRVAQGTRLRFVNEDVGMVVRHTVTSCAWPCNGAYWANYPNGDGRFHSGFIGNLDSLNGGLRMPDMLPYWDAPATLALGKYAYYCQTHPWMRGAFEVV